MANGSFFDRNLPHELTLDVKCWFTAWPCCHVSMLAALACAWHSQALHCCPFCPQLKAAGKSMTPPRPSSSSHPSSSSSSSKRAVGSQDWRP